MVCYVLNSASSRKKVGPSCERHTQRFFPGKETLLIKGYSFLQGSLSSRREVSVQKSVQVLLRSTCLWHPCEALFHSAVSRSPAGSWWRDGSMLHSGNKVKVLECTGARCYCCHTCIAEPRCPKLARNPQNRSGLKCAPLLYIYIYIYIYIYTFFFKWLWCRVPGCCAGRCSKSLVGEAARKHI